jgi:hypothetical protein
MMWKFGESLGWEKVSLAQDRICRFCKKMFTFLRSKTEGGSKGEIRKERKKGKRVSSPLKY